MPVQRGWWNRPCPSSVPSIKAEQRVLLFLSPFLSGFLAALSAPSPPRAADSGTAGRRGRPQRRRVSMCPSFTPPLSAAASAAAAPVLPERAPTRQVRGGRGQRLASRPGTVLGGCRGTGGCGGRGRGCGAAAMAGVGKHARAASSRGLMRALRVSHAGAALRPAAGAAGTRKGSELAWIVKGNGVLGALRASPFVSTFLKLNPRGAARFVSAPTFLSSVGARRPAGLRAALPRCSALRLCLCSSEGPHLPGSGFWRRPSSSPTWPTLAGYLPAAYFVFICGMSLTYRSRSVFRVCSCLSVCQKRRWLMVCVPEPSTLSGSAVSSRLFRSVWL